MLEELKTVLSDLIEENSVTAEHMRTAIGCLMDGRCSEVEIAALLVALRCRGETVNELVGAARAMRERATPIFCQTNGLLDTCGTGGDGLQTLNISTAAAFVAAAAGQPVAKHGNRSATSTSGSADVLEALGVNLQLSAEEVGQCIDEIGIGFCFAPMLHGAMKHVAPVRKELGIRTIFNMLGPLTNPANATYQLIGASRDSIAELLANALHQLGNQRALVVCGNNELDEVSLWGETTVYFVDSQGVNRQVWTAATLGLPECHVDSLKITDVNDSAAQIRQIFSGAKGPAANIVIANAAAALLAANRAPTIELAVSIAQKTLESGAVLALCDRLKEWTQKLRQ